MQSNYTKSLALVLKSEGGFVNNPKDPGGATNLGITLNTLSAWRGHTVSIADVKALTIIEAGSIYKAHYWDPVKGDSLPLGLDYAVFDYGVLTGPAKAAMTLQHILGVAQDGKIGPLTLTAIGKDTPRHLITELCTARLAFLESLSTFKTFGRGWANRVSFVQSTALAMAAAAP